jgi:hypothetical protein
MPKHQLDLVLHGHERAAQVDRDEAVPFVVGDLVRRVDRLLDAGVVERDVQAPEPLNCRAQRRANVVGARDVAGHREHLAARRLDQPCGLAVAVRRDIRHDDACAFAGEGKRGGAADAARRPGDERHLAVEPAHGRRSALIASRWSIAR